MFLHLPADQGPSKTVNWGSGNQRTRPLAVPNSTGGTLGLKDFWSLQLFGNKFKKLNFIHQSVSHWVGRRLIIVYL